MCPVRPSFPRATQLLALPARRRPGHRTDRPRRPLPRQRVGRDRRVSAGAFTSGQPPRRQRRSFRNGPRPPCPGGNACSGADSPFSARKPVGRRTHSIRPRAADVFPPPLGWLAICIIREAHMQRLSASGGQRGISVAPMGLAAGGGPTHPGLPSRAGIARPPGGGQTRTRPPGRPIPARRGSRSEAQMPVVRRGTGRPLPSQPRHGRQKQALPPATDDSPPMCHIIR